MSQSHKTTQREWITPEYAAARLGKAHEAIRPLGYFEYYGFIRKKSTGDPVNIGKH